MEDNGAKSIENYEVIETIRETAEGVMYRAVTWATLDRNIEAEDKERVSQLAEELQIEVVSDGPNDGRQYTVLADGRVVRG